MEAFVSELSQMASKIEQENCILALSSGPGVD